MNEHIALLGFKAKDKVTGFRGVITTISFDLFGCIQAVLTPPADKDGVVTGHYFDMTRLEILSKKPVMDPPDFEAGYVSTGQKGAADKPVPS